MQNKEYSGNDIDILEGLDAVRVRPGMYIGNTGTKGLHHCIYEILDNSVDESLAGECDEIIVTLKKDNIISIQDNGRGVPIDIHPKAKIPTIRVVYTILHAGGKFKEGAYKVAGGLHGVGASVVNALSEWLEVEVYKDGKIYYDKYEKGKPVVKLDSNGNLKSIGKTTIPHGTKVTFKPDNTIFETTIFNSDTIKEHIKQTCYLNSNLTIIYKDEIANKEETFHFENGLIDFMKDLTENEETNVLSDIAYFSGTYENMQAEICLRLIDEPSEKCFSFVNYITTPDDGTHVTGFRSGLTKCINSYNKDFGLKESLQGNDIRNGLIYIISFKMQDAQFEGQTKGKLGNSIAKSAMENIMSQEGPLFFDRNYKILEAIINNAIKNQNNRKKIENSKNASLPKNQYEVSNKLADCNETKTNPKNCEIFIVEGDSAGGTAKTARYRANQAILPLRGKILNVEKASLDKVFANLEIQTMITTFTSDHKYGEDLDIEKLRYGKIIIMADADVDGSHIATLLLTFFYRYFRTLITEGYVYVALTPLYIVKYTKKGSKNIDEIFLYNDKELEDFKKKSSKDGIKINNVSRAKGLGELDADQLKVAAFNKNTRRLVKINIEDAIQADKITSLLMGQKVEGRKTLITKKAKEANLDF